MKTTKRELLSKFTRSLYCAVDFLNLLTKDDLGKENLKITIYLPEREQAIPGFSFQGKSLNELQDRYIDDETNVEVPKLTSEMKKLFDIL